MTLVQFFALSLGALFLLGCRGSSGDEGRANFTLTQISGSYELKLSDGSELLELKSDGSYAQAIQRGSRQFSHIGRWHTAGDPFAGTKVVLVNAQIEPPTTRTDRDDESAFGDLWMWTHSHSDRPALVRNEVTDWSYERLR
jgi:hypothetical protein